MDLNACESPDKVVLALRAAARDAYQAADDLTSTWQDGGAGEPWQIIGTQLDKAADKIEALFKGTVWEGR